MSTETTLQQRAIGTLVGLASGDAVGTTLEFKPSGSFAPITDMVGGGPFGLEVGQWTDDTSMALCLGYSLAQHGFDTRDQMERYCDWYENGYLSATGECFDIGNTVVDALHRYRKTDEPIAGSDDPYAAGNGSLMRLAPVPLYYHADLAQCIHHAGVSSTTTHGALEAVESCELFANLLWLALHGTAKEALFARLSVAPSAAKVAAIKEQAFMQRRYADLQGTGYAIESLESALWCFMHTDSFRDAILAAANIGNDADTTAAICGQLAGAYYGIDGIPASWRGAITMGAEIEQLAVRLLQL